jgi:hypothetical protein
MSLSHTRFKRNKSSNNRPKTKKENMANKIYKLSMVGILGIIIFGGFMAISGYNSDIYPLDRVRGNLDGVISSSDPVMVRAHLVAIQSDLDIIMANLSETTDSDGKVISKNPVWIFGTESTNFIRIQNNIASMINDVDQFSSLSKTTDDYSTGMLDINDRSLLLRINIMDATPYMYVSPANMMLSVIWLAAIIGIFAVLKRKKEQLNKSDEDN